MKRIILPTAMAFIALGCWAVELEQKTWTIDGETREALLYIPETVPTNGCPLVFAFHGHGGNRRNAARQFRIHQYWPEAAVVYMQGLQTPGQLTDPEGKKNGWNCDPNDSANRDLKFFDAVYASLRKQINPKQVFSTGHSNGGSFTYCLWAARGELFTAVAPSGAAAGRSLGKLSPKPALHLAGEKDPLVKYAWQERSMKLVRRLNRCDKTGKQWASSGTLTGTLYPSEAGAPVVTLIHPGGHKFPSEAPELIVRFFKEHLLKQR